MDLLQTQIESLKSEGVADDEIARLLGVEVAAVKAATGGDVSGREIAEMLGIVKMLARDEGQAGVVRLRAATYIVDEHKGRNDKRVGAADIGNLTIAEMNRMLRQSQQALFEGLTEPAVIREIASAPQVLDVTPK